MLQSGSSIASDDFSVTEGLAIRDGSADSLPNRHFQL